MDSNKRPPLRNLTTDVNTTTEQIRILDRTRPSGPLKSDEKRNIVGVYFALSREAAQQRSETAKVMSLRAREIQLRGSHKHFLTS